MTEATEHNTAHTRCLQALRLVFSFSEKSRADFSVSSFVLL